MNNNTISINNLVLCDHKDAIFSSKIFNFTVNKPLVHQVIVAYQLKSRQGSKSQKSRSDVSGGGIKPWNQKGTGKARAGSIRSPIFRKGGVTFAARPRLFVNKINKKMYRLAILSILSDLNNNSRLIIIEKLVMTNIGVNKFLTLIKPLSLNKFVLVVHMDEYTNYLYLSTRNLSNIHIMKSSSINPALLIRFDKIVFTKKSIEDIQERLL